MKSSAWSQLEVLSWDSNPTPAPEPTVSPSRHCGSTSTPQTPQLPRNIDQTLKEGTWGFTLWVLTLLIHPYRKQQYCSFYPNRRKMGKKEENLLKGKQNTTFFFFPLAVHDSIVSRAFAFFWRERLSGWHAHETTQLPHLTWELRVQRLGF